MNKKAILFSAGACLFLTCVLVAILLIPKAFAKPQEDHKHSFKNFVEYVIEEDKAYEIRKCGCETTAKVELKNYVVATTETAQEILDNIEDGKTIVLDSGEYDNLYVRKNNTSELINKTYGTGYNIFKRTIKNVTILGTEGTTVASIVGEAADYTPNGNQHSLSSVQPYLKTYLDIQNLTIKNITFNTRENGVAVRFAGSGHKISIDGLTVDGCVFNGTGTIDKGNIVFVSDDQTAKVYKENEETVLVGNRKNITFTNNVLNNLHLGIKINYVENLNISGNQFNAIKGRDMLIGGGSGKISGNITISGNISNYGTERFIRMSNLDGILNMTNNIVLNNTVYEVVGDKDIVKITGITPESTVNFVGNRWNYSTDAEAKEAGMITTKLVGEK